MCNFTESVKKGCVTKIYFKEEDRQKSIVKNVKAYNKIHFEITCDDGEVLSYCIDHTDISGDSPNQELVYLYDNLKHNTEVIVKQYLDDDEKSFDIKLAIIEK